MTHKLKAKPTTAIPMTTLVNDLEEESVSLLAIKIEVFNI
jgi:hypothetical protein